MRFGVREICDVVLRAKDTITVGNKKFYKHEPVIYFDTLKTSSLEAAATTVYAQGGRGNARLMSWDGERTVTFTMEDALISPEGLMILSGAGLIEANDKKKIYVHTTKELTVKQTSSVSEAGDYSDHILMIDPTIVIGVPDSDETPNVYIMKKDDNGEISTEPILAQKVADKPGAVEIKDFVWFTSDSASSSYEIDNIKEPLKNADKILVDFYVEKDSGVKQIDITPESFGGNFYLEASTLFRNQNGTDLPAEFIIPNCRIQSNFTFTMASSGDPSTFTFTMDAFPDYTRYDQNKKVLASIQILDSESTQEAGEYREGTPWNQGSPNT